MVRERQTERTDRNINLLIHLSMHSLVDSLYALTRDQTCNLGVSGQGSSQLNTRPGPSFSHPLFLKFSPPWGSYSLLFPILVTPDLLMLPSPVLLFFSDDSALSLASPCLHPLPRPAFSPNVRITLRLFHFHALLPITSSTLPPGWSCQHLKSNLSKQNSLFIIHKLI